MPEFYTRGITHQAVAMFHPFPRLPPEIRQKIWHIALTEWSASAVTSRDRRAEPWSLIQGTSSIGQVCYEARLAMTKICAQIQIPPDDHLWLHSETEILFLGLASEANELLEALDAVAWPGVAHVAIIWSSWVDIAACFREFPRTCQSLRSILILFANSSTLPDIRPLERLDVEHMIDACKTQNGDHKPYWLNFQHTHSLQAWFRPPLEPPDVIYLPLL